MQNLEFLLSSNARAELARRNIIDFVSYVKKDYLPNWHHELLASYLDRFVKGEIKRLMVFMPPQHGKSELVSRMLPAFILGKQPKAKIVLASYSSTLASSFNRECQRYIDTEEYHDVFPETTLSSSNVVTVAGNWLRNSEIFETVGFGGFLKTVGVGGSLTGTPADFAIIDDPVKDSIEASSATYQMRNWDWYNDVLSTRLHNNSRVLITQTRWDESDLSGLLLRKQEEIGGGDWVILNLPALKENNDNPEDPREIGEALWPERHSKERILQIQKQSIRTFQSLYQQNPQPSEVGGEFYKMFRVALNVRKVEYNPALPLHLTFDFNVNPGMHASVWQIENVKDKSGQIKKIARKIKEIITKSPRNNTKGVCSEFKRIFPKHDTGLFIYGDPSGNNEDTRSEKGFNDYRIITTELKDYKPSLRVEKKHPAVVMRGNFINSVFEGTISDLEFIIGDNNAGTIKEYQYLKEDSDGTKLKEKAKDMSTGVSYEKYGHLSDGDDYFFCVAFRSEYIRYQQGGKPVNIRLGKNISKNAF